MIRPHSFPKSDKASHGRTQCCSIKCCVVTSPVLQSHYDSSPIANAMKNSSGISVGPSNLVAHMAIENSQFFILLKYMATTKFNRPIDLQIQIA